MLQAVHNALMGRKKKAEETRKPYKLCRIKGIFIDAALAQAGAIGHDWTQYVNDALRMRLAAEGAWPPPLAKPPQGR